MSLLYPTVFWIGLPLIGLPILIHLLNLRRQRRIRWAAMQFLIESQRRNRTWIILKQLLLLLTRMAIIAGVALLLGQLVLRSEWARFLGQGVTHHVVLIDDSFSMTDASGIRSVWDTARQTAQQLLDEATQSAGARVTLLTFSEAAKLTAGAEPQVYYQPLDDALYTQLTDSLTRLVPSQSDLDLAAGLRGVARLPQATGVPAQILHVISDYRARDFDRARDLRQLLTDLNDQFEHLHLAGCARTARDNLAIAELIPESGLRAADVEAWMNLTVTNFGTRVARDVTVQLHQDGAMLPAVILQEIPPRDSTQHRFRVRFSGTGPHWLQATLDGDSVGVDNQRFYACQLESAMPLLILDGSPDASDAYYLATGLSPHGPTRTGWQPRVEPPEFLRNQPDLNEFAAVCLIDVPRLDGNSVELLEQYLQAGGGVAFFVGPNTDRSFCNERLYRDGKGLFPVMLNRPTQLPGGRDDDGPDLQVTDHPLLRALAGTRNGFAPLMQIDHYYAATVPPSNDDSDPVDLVATLRDQSPLVVVKRFGKGRVVAQLTRISPADSQLGRWSNWGLNPVFPVLASELMGYLSAGRSDDPLFQVGETLSVEVPAAEYQPGFRFLLPTDTPQKIELPIDASASEGVLQAALPEVPRSGIYEVRLPTAEGATETRLFGVNVASDEGDLRLLDAAEIGTRLAGARFEFSYFDETAGPDVRLAGFHLRDSLLALLIGLLVGEQLLAHLASYHPSGNPGEKR